MANTVRSGSAQVDVVWRPSGLSHSAWPDVMAGPLTSKPLVLLVNSNTASASEVLAGKAEGQHNKAPAKTVTKLPSSRPVCFSSRELLQHCAHCSGLLFVNRMQAYLAEAFDALPPANAAQWLTLGVVTYRVAGALHDQGRAVLMGEKTFGKGVVQYFFPMGDGSGLKLTVAKYLTPKMYDISKNGGLSPDFVCKDYPHGEQRVQKEQPPKLGYDCAPSTWQLGINGSALGAVKVEQSRLLRWAVL